MFFSTNNGTGTSLDGKTNFPFTGIGLSLLRNHIVYATTTASTAVPSTAETSIMQMAQSLGARVWSTPWTPAVGFKSNDGPDGGNYLGSGANATNLAYASQLANYVSSMKSTYGVNIYALSVQNEPDANVTTYEACTWTGSQIHDFVTNLYSTLAAKGVGSTKIVIPESEAWSSDPGLYAPTLNDTNTAADVSIIANHDYVPNNEVGDTATPAALPVSGQATWETEVSQIGGGFDGSITNAIYWAGRIHLFMTAAQVNAWHYWWLIPSIANSDNEGLTDTNGIPARRMYVLGQFARFVRPNYYRISVTNNTGSVQVSAYKDLLSPNFAIVAINSSLTTVTQSFYLTNVTGIATVTPWMTTSNLSLASQTPVTVNGSLFTYMLPALSIVTFVGQSTSSPSLAATTVVLASGANPSTYGNPVTFTATVKTNGAAVGKVNGETMTFYAGGTLLGSGLLNSSGQASYTTTAGQLAAGVASIAAVYGGDAVYAAGTNTPALLQTVNPATLTAGLTGAVSKNYDGTTTAELAAGNYTLAGVVGGDTVTLNNPAGGTYDTRNQGTGKTVTVTGLAIAGPSATNYVLSGSSAAAAVGVINPTNLTVMATANSKTYDGTASAAALPAITAGSVQSGDTAVFVETYDTQNMGAGKTLTPSGVVNDGNGGNNYNDLFVASANGTISAATLTCTATAAGMTYGSSVPVLGGSVGGFVGGDTQASATTGTLTFTTLATASSGVGSYAINGTGLTANNNNYTFVQAAGNAQALAISPAAATVTNLLALDKVYDGTTNATLNATNAGLSGIVNGDSVTLNTSNAAGYFADPDVGTNKPVTVVGLALEGDAATNYLLLPPTNVTANIFALVTPAFASPGISFGAGGWQLSFNAQAGQSYRVLASDNVALPLNQWTVLTNLIFGAAGTATFTDPSPTNLPLRFYQIVSP